MRLNDIFESPIEYNAQDPMGSMVHDKGAAMSIRGRMKRATAQLQELSARAQKANSPGWEHEWESIGHQLKEVELNINEILHGLSELK